MNLLSVFQFIRFSNLLTRTQTHTHIYIYICIYIYIYRERERERKSCICNSFVGNHMFASQDSSCMFARFYLGKCCTPYILDLPSSKNSRQREHQSECINQFLDYVFFFLEVSYFLKSIVIVIVGLVIIVVIALWPPSNNCYCFCSWGGWNYDSFSLSFSKRASFVSSFVVFYSQVDF